MKAETQTVRPVRWLRFILPFCVFPVGAQHALGQSGACCLGNGNCLETNTGGCAIVNGEFLGPGTSCTNAVCTGACCLPEEQCTEGPADDCTAGDFQGAGSTCASHCPGPIGTGFTYQGLLKHNGLAVTDAIDLEASLWTSRLGGEQVGMAVRMADVNVVNGLFSVVLDFGPQAFGGDARFIEIGVRRPHDPTDTEPFTTLAPRQPITAVPYALHASGGTGAPGSNRLSIAAITFNGLEAGIEFNNGVVSPYDVGGAEVKGVANVSLPQNAVITAFRVCGRDFGDGDEFIGRLKRKSLTDAFGGVEEIASVSSGVAFFDQAALCIEATDITNPIIDNTQFAYYAEVENVGPVQLIAVQIDY